MEACPCLQADVPAVIDGSRLRPSESPQGDACWIKEDASGSRTVIVSAAKGAPPSFHRALPPLCILMLFEPCQVVAAMSIHNTQRIRQQAKWVAVKWAALETPSKGTVSPWL
jgi:hypothetical protein